MKRMLHQAFDCYYLDYKLNLSNARKEGKADAVHDFRVAYKKIAALFKFIIYSDSKRLYSRYIEEWKNKLANPYKLGGKLRKYQLIINQIQKLNPDISNSVLYNELNEKITQYKELFVNGLKFHRNTSSRQIRLMLKSIDDDHGIFNENRFKEFYTTISSDALNQLETNPPEHWHDIRRQLKVCYLLSSSGIKNSNLPSEISILYRTAEQDLGKWHDLMVLKNFLIKNNIQTKDDLNGIIIQINSEMIAIEEMVINSCGLLSKELNQI